MTEFFPEVRHPRPSRVLIAAVLLLALVGGTGIVAADGEDNSGAECPDENPTRAYERTSEQAVVSSAEGRTEALEATECT